MSDVSSQIGTLSEEIGAIEKVLGAKWG